MRKVFLVIIAGMISLNVFGTAQIPDILIYDNDTIRLYSNPLESFYNDKNPRPTDFGIGGCWSTACWRGYQATWEIKNNELYLIEMADCCFWEKYLITDSVLNSLKDDIAPELIDKIKSLKGERFDFYDFQKKLKKKLGKKDFKKNKQIIYKTSLIPRRKANLEKLFGQKCIDGHVFASWFSGALTVPRGKLVEYVHMGYMSKYEKELVLTIEDGSLIYAVEYENKQNKIDNDFGVLQATSYSVVVPRELVKSEKPYLYTLTDTISFSSLENKNKIEAYSKFNNERKTMTARQILVENTIDSLSASLSMNYAFSTRKTEKLRWGTASWIDGISKKQEERVRIFTMSNINSQVIIYYFEKDINQEEFENKANYITHSLKLMEFGY